MMKKTSTSALFLTLLMFMLVLAAAVVFLVMRKDELDQEIAAKEVEFNSLSADSRQMQTDLEMRNSLQVAAETTREVLEAEIVETQLQASEREAELTQMVDDISQTRETLQGLEDSALQISVFAPEAARLIRPHETIDLYVVAIANKGVASVVMTVDGDALPSFEADGESTYSFQTQWTPMRIAEYEIGMVVQDVSGQSTEPVTLTVKSGYVSLEAQREAVSRQVEADLTELRFPAPVADEAVVSPLVSPQVDIHRLLLTGESADSTAATLSTETLVLRAFDLLQDGESVEAFEALVLDGRLLGAYDAETSGLRLYHPSGVDGTMSGPEGAFGRWIQVHEVTHLLQDERFGLGLLAINALDPDMRMALRALVEGEATYLQAVVATGDTFTDEERSGLMTGLQTATVEPPAEVPDYSLDHFAFAYTAGLNFVQTLVEQGGFAALDAAWTNLPRSTEQILHPDRYDTYELPLQVSMEPFEDVLGEGWQPVENKILGEWQLSRHLMSQLSFEESARAAGGWGGGHYTVYWLQEEDALVLAFQLAWDTPEDAMDFAQVYATYLNNRFEDQGTPQNAGALCWLGDVAICLYDFDGDSFVVRAPDLDMALAIAASQTG